MNKTWGVVGCGWLGLELSKSLIEKGHYVHGTTSTPEKINSLEELGISAHLFKLEDFQKEAEWLKEIDILVLNIPPSSFGDTYALAMAGAAKQVKESCKVVFVSSTSVYPNHNKEIDENTPTTGTQRNGPYVSSAEIELQELLEGRLTILRMSGLVGGNRHPVKFMSGREIKGADQPINLVHRDDCIGIIQTTVEKNFWGKTLNVCASQHPSKDKYYIEFATKYDLDPPVFISNGGDGKIISNLASIKELGYNYIYDDPFDFPV